MNWKDLVETVARQGEAGSTSAGDGDLAVPSPETIAFFVQFQRHMMGWKKETLADFARVSLSTIERIERCEPVSNESLDRVAEALRQPRGAFTVPRIPLSSEEAAERLHESTAPFEDTVAVSVRPLRGHRQIADLGKTDFNIVDASRLGDAYDDDIATLREWLDLVSFVITTEDKDSIFTSSAERVKRRELYNDVLGCVREIERRGHAVALAGTYQVKTGNEQLPEVNVALVAFFPKMTDPAAINRKTLFGPAHIDLSKVWAEFCNSSD